MTLRSVSNSSTSTRDDALTDISEGAGNCYDVPANYTSKLETAKALFPMVNAADFDTYVVPDTAHGINFHPTSAEGASFHLNSCLAFGADLLDCRSVCPDRRIP